MSFHTKIQNYLQVGKLAPDFEAIGVFDDNFFKTKLSNYRGKKYVVLIFYPLNFTYVCPTELLAFAERIEEFDEKQTQLLGISVDSPFSHLAWLQTSLEEGGVDYLPYPLVSDLTKKISLDYNVLNDDGVALRGLFVIDKDGILQYATTNNLALGRNVDEILRILEAIQHIQEYPQRVCPSNWRPGLSTIRATQMESKKYFKSPKSLEIEDELK